MRNTRSRADASVVLSLIHIYKIFLATCTEVGLSGDVTAGSKLAIFSNDASRQAKPTAEAVLSLIHI